MKKRLISVLLACMMILTVLPVLVGANETAAVDDIVIRIENEAQLTMTQGSTVSVEVYMDINTENGVVSATIPVAWNNKTLELTGVENGTVIPTGWCGAPVDSIHSAANDEDLGIYYLAWNNDLLCEVDDNDEPVKDEVGNYVEKSYTGKGLLCTLTFKLRETVTADQTYDVEIVTDKNDAAIMNIMTWYMEDFLNQNNEDDIYGQTVKFEAGGIVTIDRVRGDLNNDNAVTISDAIYLMYHTFYGDKYAIADGEGDYNKDGIVAISDAIYLMYHTFYGDKYPLN